MLNQENLQLRKHLVSFAKEKGITLWLFGSFARGTEKLTSDVDVLIEAEHLSFEELLVLPYDLKRIINRDMDILFSNYVDTKTLSITKARGVKLWEA